MSILSKLIAQRLIQKVRENEAPEDEVLSQLGKWARESWVRYVERTVKSPQAGMIKPWEECGDWIKKADIEMGACVMHNLLKMLDDAVEELIPANETAMFTEFTYIHWGNGSNGKDQGQEDRQPASGD